MSVIGLTKIGVIVVAAWLVYLGALLVIVAWRGINAQTGLGRS
jgi:hypothetical protein